MGVTGAGKSTIGRLLSAQLGWAFVDGDELHPRANIEKMHRGEPLDDADREPWLARLAQVIAGWLAESRNGVLASSALKGAYRRRLMLAPARMRLVLLTAPRGVLERRLHDRKGHFMPPALLDSQFATLEEPGDDEQPVVVSIASPPDAITDAVVWQLKERTHE